MGKKKPKKKKKERNKRVEWWSPGPGRDAAMLVKGQKPSLIR